MTEIFDGVKKMDLIDRYLQAVKFWLPREQKQDIIAELAEDLRSQIEERESTLGRKLNEAEVENMLKERGRPLLVANRFLPQEALVGPVLFPIYKFVLKRVVGFYMVPWTLAWIGIAVARAAHSGQSLIGTAALFWTSFWPVALFWLGGVTVVFAILERVQAKSRFLENWDPRKLPPVHDPNQIPISRSVTDLIVNMIFFFWWAFWVGELWYQTLIHFAGVTITLAPSWRYFFWGYLLLAAGNAGLSAVNLFRPYWTWIRASIRLVSNGIGSLLFCWLVKANIVVALSVTDVAPEKSAQIAQAINWWLGKMFPWAVGVCLIVALSDIYRIIRVRTPRSPRVVLKRRVWSMLT